MDRIDAYDKKFKLLLEEGVRRGMPRKGAASAARKIMQVIRQQQNRLQKHKDRAGYTGLPEVFERIFSKPKITYEEGIAAAKRLIGD